MSGPPDNNSPNAARQRQSEQIRDRASTVMSVATVTSFFKMNSDQKRKAFGRNSNNWATLSQLVADAKCYDNVERIKTLLCLTAIHDIMKVTGCIAVPMIRLDSMVCSLYRMRVCCPPSNRSMRPMRDMLWET